MSEDILFVGWNRPVTGREQHAVELFSMFTNYLTGMQKKDAIASFEPVLLGMHGGDLNGFVIVRGDHKKLETMAQSDEFQDFTMRGTVELHGFGVLNGWTGNKIPDRLKRYTKAVSKL